MIYFDNAASSKICDEAMEEFQRVGQVVYGNPHAKSKMGMMAEEEVKRSIEILARGLKCNEDELVITSCATESNNMFLRGVVKRYKRKGNHIITQKSEHSAVKSVAKQLENEGVEVTYLDVDEKGVISIQQLKESLKENTILVSIMHVNNETGAIMPIEEIVSEVKKYNKEILVHVDGVQSFGKLDVNFRKLNIDGYSFTGHKIHAPKGVGGLIIKDGVKVESLIYGGNHQNGRRAGTVNVSGVASLAKAFETWEKNKDEYTVKVGEVKKELLKLLDELDGVVVNGNLENSSNYLLNLSFEHIRGEVLLHGLSELEIYVSTGTSCNSTGTGMLTTYGYSKERILGSVRFGLSRYNTVEEARETVEEIKKLVGTLRKFKKR